MNGVTTKYFIEGDRIVLEKVGNEERAFWYDGNGNAAAFVIYDAAGMHPYYYFRNGQGDIIGLFDGGQLPLENTTDNPLTNNGISVFEAPATNREKKSVKWQVLLLFQKIRIRSLKYASPAGYWVKGQILSPFFIVLLEN